MIATAPETRDPRPATARGNEKKLVTLLFATTTLLATDTPDLMMQTRIRQEGLRNSKVIDIASG